MAEHSPAASTFRLNTGNLVHRTGDDRLWKVLAVYEDGAALIECVGESWNRFKFEPAADLKLAS
jgi:hypothetical protein